MVLIHLAIILIPISCLAQAKQLTLRLGGPLFLVALQFGFGEIAIARAAERRCHLLEKVVLGTIGFRSFFSHAIFAAILDDNEVKND